MNTILKHPTPADSATRAGHVILVDRSDDETVAINPAAGQQRYVTSWLGEGDSSWRRGHYFSDRLDAIDDFVFRARRGY